MQSKNGFLNILITVMICFSSIGLTFFPKSTALASEGLLNQSAADPVLYANTLAVYAVLSGYVYQQDGSTPLGGALVEAENPDAGTVESTNTDASGYYKFEIASGDYYVSVTASGYGKEYYDNTYDSSNATMVTVEESTGASEINFTLLPEATVTGYVYESDGSTPIVGASICLDPASGMGDGFNTVSGADGSYSFAGLSSGSYTAYAYADDHYGEYYLNQSISGLANVVSVTQPNTTTGINFTLEAVTSISGHVYQADGTTPIDGAWVYAMDENFQFIQGSISQVDGTYEILLTAGNYYLAVSAEGFGGVYYDNGYDDPHATLVTVESGTSGPSGIDFTLSPEATISGYVYGSDGVTPLSGVSVRAEPTAGGQQRWATSEVDGSYSILGLSSGSYVVIAEMDGYASEYYLNASSSETAAEIVVTQPNDTSGINFSLSEAGSITGFVYNSNSEVITDALISVHALGVSEGSSSLGTYVSQEDGSYTITGLAPGTYKIIANNNNDPNYEILYYNDKYTVNTADTVTVTANNTSGPYNFLLGPARANPAILVHPLTDDIEGWDWEPNASISLTIGTYTKSMTSDGEGHFHFYISDFDIQAGQLVEINDGTNFDDHLVLPTAIVSIDPVNDIVYGTAEAGSELAAGVWVGDIDVYADPNPVTDSNGDWEADFSGAVDIVPGMNGWVNQWDSDGDTTQLHWWLPSPHILVHPLTEDIEGWDWEPDATITLTIGEYTNSMMSDGEGHFHFYLDDFDIQAGQLVEIDDETNFDDHLVLPTAIVSIDPVNDIVYGTAEVGSELAAGIWVGETDVYADPNPVTDGKGDWLADFSGEVDIVPGMNGWVNQWDDDGDTTQIHWYLPEEGAVLLTGHVYQSDGVTPISNAHVYAMDDYFDYVQGTNSQANGIFEIWVQPGQYYLAVSVNGFGGVYYENGYDDDSATLVTAEEGTGASGLDFALSPEATISGIIFESDGVTPISGARVQASPYNGGQTRETWSGPDGSYTLHGLSSGNYRVYAWANGYSTKYYSTAVSVTQPDNTPGININLERAYRLSGHVYEEDGVTPITSGGISIRNTLFNGVASTGIGEGGYYEVWLPAGQYYVATFWTEGFGGELYDNACGGTNATLVTVAGPDGVSGIDFQLGPEAVISGYVFGSDGVTPAENGYVYLKPVGDGVRWISGTTDEGFYQIGGLCSGDYILYAGAPGYKTEYYQDKTTEAEAIHVTLTQPNETTGINFVLDNPVFNVEGKITLPDGVTPLTGVTVRYDSTHSALTDANGEFLLAEVPPGTYTLTPSLAGYVFDPASITVEIIDSDSTDNLFTAYAIPAAFAKTSPATASINQGTGGSPLSWGAAV